MSFKDISYLELRRPLCSVSGNQLCKFGRGHYEEHFYKIKLNLDQWLRRTCCFVERKHLCNFGGMQHVRNNSVKLF